MFPLKTYNRYIFKNLFRTYLFILLALTSIIWIVQATSYLRYISKYNLTPDELLILIISLLPGLMVLTIPLCTFIAVLFYYNHISGNNELIILRNSGLKNLNLLTGAALTGIISSIFLYFITFYLMPRGDALFSRLYKSLNSNVVKFILDSHSFDSYRGIVLNSKETHGNRMNSFLVYIRSEKVGEKSRLLYAKNAELVANRYLKFSDGNIQFIEPTDYDRKHKKNNVADDEEVSILFFKEYTIDTHEFLPPSHLDNYKIDKYTSIRDLLKAKKLSRDAIIEILYSYLNPLLSILLALMSAIMVLKTKFSRLGSNMRQNGIIFTLNILIFGIFTKSFKEAGYSNWALVLMLISVVLPLLYVILSLVRENDK